MKKISFFGISILLIFWAAGLYAAGVDTSIIAACIIASGFALYRALPEISEFLHPQEKQPEQDDKKQEPTILTNYEGRELEIHLYSRRIIKGKVAPKDDPRILTGYILLKDVHITDPDDEKDIAIEHTEIWDEFHVDLGQIETFGCKDMDKIPDKKLRS